ncbi:MAG: hypothetical protein K0R47_5961 [Brevibacillus sp.]|nr:hypothetical protein [Brevibacillus sp.]
MIGISSIHRRLAELQLKATRLGGWHKLDPLDQTDLHHCLRHNAAMIQRLDELKQLSYIAYTAGDVEWHHDICVLIEKAENQF